VIILGIINCSAKCEYFPLSAFSPFSKVPCRKSKNIRMVENGENRENGENVCLILDTRCIKL
jgi:hypothetical protein